MYVVGIKHERTPEQYQDPFLAWERPDDAFFAAGACHILALMFLELHAGEGYELVHLKPKHHDRGHHMYASNGTWAFDFNGWTREAELLAAYKAAYAAAYQGWECERTVAKDNFREFVLQADHRPPEYFPHLPWDRAYKYLKRFDQLPPAA